MNAKRKKNTADSNRNSLSEFNLPNHGHSVIMDAKRTPGI